MSVSKGHVHSDNEEPIRLGGGSIVRWPDLPTQDVPKSPRWQDRVLREALRSLPEGIYEANRYDTDDEHVLHLWRDGESWDIRVAKETPA